MLCPSCGQHFSTLDALVNHAMRCSAVAPKPQRTERSKYLTASVGERRAKGYSQDLPLRSVVATRTETLAINGRERIVQLATEWTYMYGDADNNWSWVRVDVGRETPEDTSGS